MNILTLSQALSGICLANYFWPALNLPYASKSAQGGLSSSLVRRPADREGDRMGLNLPLRDGN
jgi:hypothetical protein